MSPPLLCRLYREDSLIYRPGSRTRCQTRTPSGSLTQWHSECERTGQPVFLMWVEPPHDLLTPQGISTFTPLKGARLPGVDPKCPLRASCFWKRVLVTNMLKAKGKDRMHDGRKKGKVTCLKAAAFWSKSAPPELFSLLAQWLHPRPPQKKQRPVIS